MSSAAVQSQAEKVRALKAAHAPQLEVTAAIEELKRLKSEDSNKSASIASESKDVTAKDTSAQDAEDKTVGNKEAKPKQGEKQAAVKESRSTADVSSQLTLEAAAEKVKNLKQSHASQANVSQAVAEYVTLKSSHSLDPVAVAAERVRVLKEAHAPQDLVIAAINEYKQMSAVKRIEPASSSFSAPASASTPASTPALASALAVVPAKAAYRPLPSHPEPLQPACSIEAISHKVKTLKANGASQEQVAAAVAELTAFRAQGSLDPRSVAEAKVRTLKNARAPQQLVQGAVDELKNLNPSASVARSGPVNASLQKERLDNNSENSNNNSKNRDGGGISDSSSTKSTLVKHSKEVQKPDAGSSSGKSEAKEVKALSSEVRIWESENFDDFQARIAARPNDSNKRSIVSETGISAPITATAATIATAPAATTANQKSHNLSSAREQSESAEKRISELSALCEKHFKLSVDATELQKLRAESANLLARNALLRKSQVSHQSGVTSSKVANSSSTRKASQGTPTSVTQDSGDKAFSAWQKSFGGKCDEDPDSSGWPGTYWIEEAKKIILSANKRADLDVLLTDHSTGQGRAAQFLFKQFPPP